MCHGATSPRRIFSIFASRSDDEPLAVATVLFFDGGALGGIERRAEPRVVQHLLLRKLRLVEVAGLADRRFLGVGHRMPLDPRVLVPLLEALHRELERRLQRFIVSHGSGLTADRVRGRLSG